MRSSALLAALLSGAAFVSCPAFAQTSVGPAGDPVPSGDVDNPTTVMGELEEVVVTAQRQVETAQRAAIAISVLQPDVVAQVTDPAGLTKLVPALQIGNGGASPLLYVRGVGSFSANPYTDSAVAVNYDGVYLGRATSTFGLFYDLQRVEVLKGPQGTLYGRNATGGALNILPAQPVLGETSGNASLSLGNYDAVTAQAAVNVGLSDKTAIRLAGTTYSHDGYNTDGTFSEKGSGGRAQVLFEPSETLKLRVGGDFFHLRGTNNTAVLLGTTDQRTGAVVSSGLGPSVGFYDPQTIAILNNALVTSAGAAFGPLPARPYMDNKHYGMNGELTADFDFGTLTVVGAWRRSDLDSLAQPVSFLQRYDEVDEQYSGEARLDGSIGSLDWLVGAYYFHESVDATYFVNSNLFGSSQELNAVNESLAGFGRLTWHVSDNFRLTAAGRYTGDEKRFDGVVNAAVAVCTSPSHSCPNIRRLPADISNLPAALASIGFIQPPGSPVYIDATGGSGAIYSPSQIVVDDKTTPSKFTYRAGVEFDPRDRTLLYASVETGYRAGGFSFSSVKPVYGPETITAYTVGAKNRFLDNTLQVNLEGFIWKYEDQQVTHQAIGTAGGLEFVTENVGKSTNQGLEVELVAKPLPRTLLNAVVQYLDARNDTFVFSDVDSSTLAGLPPGSILPTTNCPATFNATSGTYSVDCSGKRALRSPRWTINLGIQQKFPLTGDYELGVEANTRYQTSNIVMFERSAFSVQPAYWMSDASVTLYTPDDAWSLQAFVNNIENKRVLNNTLINSIGGIYTGNYNPPRTYGVRLNMKF
jgi:iron complex outermembrane receptor protein